MECDAAGEPDTRRWNMARVLIAALKCAAKRGSTIAALHLAGVCQRGALEDGTGRGNDVVPMDPCQAAQWLFRATTPRAQPPVSGDAVYAPAVRALGLCYQHGVGVVPHKDLAYHNLLQAAKLGCVEAYFDLASYHKRAVLDHLRQAAQGGHPPAQFMLFKKLRRAGQVGEVAAELELGTRYESGQGVGKDLPLAMEMYRRASSRGNDDTARLKLAKCLARTSQAHDATQAVAHLEVVLRHRGSECDAVTCEARMLLANACRDGAGMPADPRRAFELYSKQSEHECSAYASAVLNVCDCYRRGFGVDKDEEQAFTHLDRMVKSKYANDAARVALSECYIEGSGTPKNLPKGVALLRQCHSAQAIYRLGLCARDGIGMLYDPAAALAYFRRAGDGGVVEAQLQAGLCYLRGVGAAKNLPDAKLWLRRAAQGGSVAAAGELARLCEWVVDGELSINRSIYWHRRVAAAAEGSVSEGAVVPVAAAGPGLAAGDDDIVDSDSVTSEDIARLTMWRECAAGDRCVVCQGTEPPRLRIVAAMPCSDAHLLCLDCAVKVTRCPMCRAEVPSRGGALPAAGNSGSWDSELGLELELTSESESLGPGSVIEE